MMKKALNFFLIGLIFQAVIVVAQTPGNNKKNPEARNIISSDTSSMTLLLNTTHNLINKSGQLKINLDSANQALSQAEMINDKIKSDKFYGIINLRKAELYYDETNYEKTVFYAKAAIPYLLKFNLYPYLAYGYLLYSIDLTFDRYDLKMSAIRKADFYYHKIGDKDGEAQVNFWIDNFSGEYKNYVIANKNAKRLRAAIIPGKEDTAQALLYLKIADYQIKKPLELAVDLDSAKYFIQKAQSINSKINDPKCTAIIAVTLADLYDEHHQSEPEEAQIKIAIGILTKAKLDYSLLGDLYFRMSGFYSNNDSTFNKENDAILEAIRLYHLSGQAKKEADALAVIGQANADKKTLDLAIRQYMRAIKLYKSVDYPGLPRVYYLASRIAEGLGNMDTTLLYLMEAVKTFNSTTSNNIKLGCTGDLMMYYTDNHMASQAIFWAKKCSEIALTIRRFDFYYTSIQILVKNLITLGRTKEALRQFQQAIKEQPPATVSSQRIVDETAAECYIALHQNKEAEHYIIDFENSFKNYAAEFKSNDQQAYFAFYGNALYKLARFYDKINKEDKARTYIIKMDAIVSKERKIIPVSLLLMEQLEFKIDTALKDYKSALSHYEHAVTINDSLFSLAKTKQIQELTLKYETDAKEKNIKILQSRAAIQNAKFKELNLQRNLVLAGIVIFFIIAAISYYGYRTKKRTNQALKAKQSEINEQNLRLGNLVGEKDKLLSEKEVLLKDKEMLMQEIHHRVKNNLHMISSLLESQSAFLADEALLAIQKSQHRVQAISLIHQKLYITTNVTEVAMDVYLREIITYLRDSFITHENIIFNIDLIPLALNVGQAVPLGLIVNEAITNAIKYAFTDGRLGHIAILLRYLPDDSISLLISDNGIGIFTNYRENQSSHSLGMNLIKGLAKTIGGKILIESGPGTKIELAFKKVDLYNNEMED